MPNLNFKEGLNSKLNIERAIYEGQNDGFELFDRCGYYGNGL